MDPQLMALMALLSGASNFGGPQAQGAGGGGLPDNSELLNALRGPSPVNTNANYGSTVGRFFNQSPFAGPQPYQTSSPIQSGLAGNNAVRSGTGHSSFMPTDFNSSMQKWIGP